MQPTISVVLPVFNERENLDALVERLSPVLRSAAGDSYEVLFVDDGSRDGSSEMLDALCNAHPRFKAIHFSRNFGHQAALQAGLDESRGRAVALMDADLQDPPELLAEFMEKWRQGYDVVYAIRRKRKENFLKRAAYACFYRSMRVIAEIDIPLDAGDFCLMDRRVVEALVSLRERNRFLRGLRSWVGFRQVAVEYERSSRHAGDPKYTLRKLVGLALSGYLGFSAMPLRMATWFGFLSAAVGFVTAFWVLLTHLLNIPAPRGWASTLSVMLFLGGVQMLLMGVIGEYLSRVYDEVRGRPLYVIGSKVGWPEREAEVGWPECDASAHVSSGRPG